MSRLKQIQIFNFFYISEQIHRDFYTVKLLHTNKSLYISINNNENNVYFNK